MMNNIPNHILYLSTKLKDYSIYAKHHFTKIKAVVHIVINQLIIEEHLFKTDVDTKHTCKIQVPQEGDQMALRKYSNLLELPFMVYADLESSLTPTGEAQTIHVHKANSAWCYFVCTFYSSRNKCMTL